MDVFASKMNTSTMHGKVLTVSMELAMNFATGFMLHQERDKIRALSKEHADRGDKKFTLKSADWLVKEVYEKMKRYELEQNQMEVDVKEDETEEQKEEEEEEEEKSEEEKEQKKWLAVCVRDMMSDYEYEAAAMRRVLKKVADDALQVIM